ncbi:MAG: interleukin-like EMT inducer domain-containing protein [Ardenticatenaceae bacterium]
MNERKKTENSTSVRSHLLVAGLYFVLALLLWWPLPEKIMTHVPGSDTWAFDEYTFVWNIWWFRHALLDLGVNPLHSDYIFHPLGIDLVLYTYNILNALIALPLLDWLGPVLTSNLILIGMTVLSGWGTWLLVRWLLARRLGAVGVSSHAAAWGAGLLYAFGAYRAIYAAIGHYDMVSTGFIPLFVLFFLKTFWGRDVRRGATGFTKHPSPSPLNLGEEESRLPIAESGTQRRNQPRPTGGYWTSALLTGIFMAGALLNEMIFGVFLAMLGLILMALTWRQASWGWFMRMVVAVITAALLWAPVGLPVVRTLLSTDFVLSGWGDALKLSADLLSFTSPTALHPLWGPDWEQELRNVQVNVVSPGASRFSDVNTVFVGMSSLLLCVLALLALRRRVTAWAVGLCTFMVLSLGPVLQVGGRYLWDFDNVLPNGQPTAVPMPFILLHYIPIVQGNRAANRFSVVLMLCAAVLVGYALWWVAKIINQRVGNARVGAFFASLLGTALLVEQLSLPLPLTDATIPKGYEIVRQDPDDVAVLTLPLGWRNSFGVIGAENTRNEWYMAGHGKRLLQGNISRAPAEKFEYWQKVPLLRSLIEIQNDREVSEEQKASDAQQALDVMALFGVRYVAVHPAVAGRPPYVDNRERALAYLQDVLPLEALYQEDDLLLYRVAYPSTGSGHRPLDQAGLSLGKIDFGTPESEVYQVAGWHQNEIEGAISYNWAMEESRLLLPIADHNQPLKITVQLRPFQLPQTIQPFVNEQPIGDPISLEPGWNERSFTIPAAQLEGPTARITLRFSRADLPIDVLPGISQIGQTGVEVRSSITVKSGGPGIGDLAWITVDGADASDHRNGTNVTVVDPATQRVEAIHGFDTAANEFERDKLHQLIADIPEGKIVIVAFKGAATSYLNLDTVAAFKTLGATTGPTDHAVSYALIGVKGAPEGSALEGQSKTETVDLLFLPDDRALSSAIDWVYWTQND